MAMQPRSPERERWEAAYGRGCRSSPGLNPGESATRGLLWGEVRPLGISSNVASSSSVLVTVVSKRFSGFGSPL